MTGLPSPKLAYQTLIPLTEASPLSELGGRVGVGGRVSHCGSLFAALLINKVTKNTRFRTPNAPWFPVKPRTLPRPRIMGGDPSQIRSEASSVAPDQPLYARNRAHHLRYLP